MRRSLMSMAMTLLCVLGIFAQAAPQLTPLPLDENVRHGVLPNGLKYYLLHNEEPKERANFYIAQKVGSTLETPEQLGLAHFLEHMAFNGTTNYPGKTMLEYLQSKGLRFGADINAYTSFDETVYNINNVHSTDQELMDKVLLVLHDWSCEILLEESEIDAERGVIEEEWRGRNDANTRMFSTILPKIYKEYQYQQMPIGSMDVVRNFKPQVIRDYYHKWYRPDQQGIVIVGDFDVAEMEQKVIDMFTPIPMPENAALRTYPVVSDNDAPIFVTFRDPELKVASARICFKSDVVPFEMRNTFEMYMMNDLAPLMISQLINNRLTEYRQTNPDCKYAYAATAFDKFLISKTKDAFTVMVIAKDDLCGATKEAMEIVARACKTGFTDSELSRVRDEILSNIDNQYNERNKTNNDDLANQIIRHFIDNNPYPGIVKEHEILNQVLPTIPVQALNEMASQVLTKNNQVIIVSEPQGDDSKYTGFVDIVENAIDGEYEAYVDEVITEPLIAEAPKPGSIISSSHDDVIDADILTLSNGAKVVVKTTDFAADEVSMTGFREGGKRMYSPSQAANVKLASAAADFSQVGPFDNVKLGKYLAGKQVGFGIGIGNMTDDLSGKSTVKDVATLFELIYANFTSLSADQKTYDSQMAQVRTFIANKDKDPNSIFQDSIAAVTYRNNPLMTDISVADIDKASYPEMLAMVKNILSNAADFTFIFTGNVTVETLKPLIETYIASLPSTGKANVVDAAPITPVVGKVSNEFKQPMQTPSTMVYNVVSGKLPFDVSTVIKVDIIGQILRNIYTATLREEEGGTYSPYASGQYNGVLERWNLTTVFQTNAAQQEKLIKRATEELKNLLSNGASEEQFSKVKEATLKQYEIRTRTNKFWESRVEWYMRGRNYVTGYEDAIKNLTLEDLNSFMKSLVNYQDDTLVVMEGIEAK